MIPNLKMNGSNHNRLMRKTHAPVFNTVGGNIMGKFYTCQICGYFGTHGSEKEARIKHRQHVANHYKMQTKMVSHV